jgi:hypothetical protein
MSLAGLDTGVRLTTTGNADLDQSLASELNRQAAFFGYRPAFALYRGGEKNAAATTERLLETPTDGTVLYSLDLLEEHLKTNWGGAIVAGILAHEFAHIFQFFTNLMSRLRSMGSTLKYVELHADFLSGFYMGGKDRSIDLKPYTDAFFEIGDYGFTNPDHHGTPQERFFVLKSGYNHRLSKPNATLADASREAEKLLREYIR